MPFDIGLIDIGEQHVGNTPQFEAPTLAELTRQIYARPLWQMQEAAPLETDIETYKRARAEMIAIQQARGFPMATAVIGRENFLLRGIPIVVSNG